jgi:hypothetical protein
MPDIIVGKTRQPASTVLIQNTGQRRGLQFLSAENGPRQAVFRECYAASGEPASSGFAACMACR